MNWIIIEKKNIPTNKRFDVNLDIQMCSEKYIFLFIVSYWLASTDCNAFETKNAKSTDHIKI